MAAEYPKKYWWLVLIVVPIIVAIIPILKDSGKDQEKEAGDTINMHIVGNQFTGDVVFNNRNVIINQAQQTFPQSLPDGFVEKLTQAMDLIQSRDFYTAIPLLRSVAETAPVPALFNNLGAAYLATGDLEKAAEYLNRARNDTQEDEATTSNLKQLQLIHDVVEDAVDPRVVTTKASPLSAIVVEPRTLERFPAIEEVYVLKSDARRDFHGMSPIAKTNQFGTPMIVPAGTYDIAIKPEGGRSGSATLLVINLNVSARQTVTLHTNGLAAAITVSKMEGVPVGGIYVVHAGYRRDRFAVITHKGYVEAAKGFDTVMLLTAGGNYDVLLDVGPDTVLFPIAENISPGAGEIFVIGQ